MKNFKEKFGKIKFVMPIVLGLIGMWLIYNFVPNRNLNEKVSNIFFYFCDVWFSYLASKHWWKMARDEKYKKEREGWLKTKLSSRFWFQNSQVKMFILLIVSYVTLFLVLLTRSENAFFYAFPISLSVLMTVGFCIKEEKFSWLKLLKLNIIGFVLLLVVIGTLVAIAKF